MSRPPPSQIEYCNYRFLITDMPSNKNMSLYIRNLQEHNVSAVVRFSSSSYNYNLFQDIGIAVYDLIYEDGSCPSNILIKQWMGLLKEQFSANSSTCVAVHCSAGLGRAPVMVALALMELGLQYEDAVELIREKRRGAINMAQLRFLERYRRKSRLKIENEKKCIIL